MSGADPIRDRLLAHRRRREAHQAEGRDLIRELAQLTRQAEREGATKVEVARLTGAGRDTVYRALAATRD